MSRKDKVTISVWVAIVTLVAGLIITGGGSAISYGKMEQRVSNIGNTAEDADTRSHANQVLINRIDSKLDTILTHVKK